MVPHGQTVGYVRVSSADQNLARKLESIGPVDRLFQDQVSRGLAPTAQALPSVWGTCGPVTPSGLPPWIASPDP